MSMSNDFRQALDRFVEERTLDIGNHLISNHEDYIQLVNQRLSIQQELENLLPDNYQKLVSEFEKIESLLQGIIFDAAYLEGFKDGVRL